MTDQMLPNETPKGDQSNKSINTEGGAYVRGAVNSGGHFIGRDWIQYVTSNFEDAKRLQNRKALLQLVKTFWIEGVLEQSLYQEVLINVEFKMRMGAVESPLNMLVRISEEPDYRLPSSTRILDVFDKVNHSILILGKPGSGKTTHRAMQKCYTK